MKLSERSEQILRSINEKTRALGLFAGRRIFLKGALVDIEFFPSKWSAVYSLDGVPALVKCGPSYYSLEATLAEKLLQLVDLASPPPFDYHLHKMRQSEHGIS